MPRVGDKPSRPEHVQPATEQVPGHVEPAHLDPQAIAAQDLAHPGMPAGTASAATADVYERAEATERSGARRAHSPVDERGAAFTPTDLRAPKRRAVTPPHGATAMRDSDPFSLALYIQDTYPAANLATSLRIVEECRDVERCDLVAMAMDLEGRGGNVNLFYRFVTMLKAQERAPRDELYTRSRELKAAFPHNPDFALALPNLLRIPDGERAEVMALATMLYQHHCDTLPPSDHSPYFLFLRIVLQLIGCQAEARGPLATLAQQCVAIPCVGAKFQHPDVIASFSLCQPSERAGFADLTMQIARRCREVEGLLDIPRLLACCGDPHTRMVITDCITQYLDHYQGNTSNVSDIITALIRYPLLEPMHPDVMSALAGQATPIEFAQRIKRAHVYAALQASGVDQHSDAAHAYAMVLVPVDPRTQPSPADRHMILDAMRRFPEVAKVMSRDLETLFVEFYDSGNNGNSFTPFFHQFVPDVRLPSDALLKARMAQIAPNVDAPVALALDAQPTAACGRTLIFHMPDDPPGYHTTIKLPKTGENVDDATSGLRREEWMDRVVHSMRNEMGLEGALPQPAATSMVRIQLTPHMLALVEQESARFGGKEFEIAYNHDTGEAVGLRTLAPDGYHTYLSDPSLTPDQLRSASAINLRDYARLLRAGCVHGAPSDLCHNSNDQRPFIWNTEEVFKVSANIFGDGPGRLDRAIYSARTANMRTCGPADLKHCFPVSAILEDHPRADFYTPIREHAAEIATIGSMGDILLSWVLVMTDSWLKRRELGPEMTIDLGTELHLGFAEFYATYAGISRDEALVFLASIIDFARMAHQITYFSTDAYAKEAAQPGGITKERWAELYGPLTDVTWRMADGSRGWIPTRGWLFDGMHRDWGPVNGPMPCQELMKALSAMRFAMCP